MAPRTEHMMKPLETALRKLAPPASHMLMVYMRPLYASQNSHSVPGTFQYVFHYLLKNNNIPNLVLGDAPAPTPISLVQTPCIVL